MKNTQFFCMRCFLNRKFYYSLTLLLLVSSGAFAQLYPGQFAPSFSVKDIDGQFHSVDQYKGKQMLISFYRNISSPASLKRFLELEQEQSFLRRKDVVAIAVFPSCRDNLLKFRDTSGFYQLMVSDTSEILYRLFEVGTVSGFRPSLLRKKTKTAGLPDTKHIKETNISGRVAAEILIGPEGNIKYTHYGSSESDHLKMNLLKAQVDSL